jgi:hypothetical protein
MGKPHHRHPKICGRFSTSITGEKLTGAADGMAASSSMTMTIVTAPKK